MMLKVEELGKVVLGEEGRHNEGGGKTDPAKMERTNYINSLKNLKAIKN